MKAVVRAAYAATRRGFSADRVIADPELNLAFIADCRRRGLTQSAASINQTLLNLRKGRGLRGMGKTTETSFPNEDEYRFASEIAVRFLERRDGLSLDQIVCDPTKALEFDKLASQIAAGYSPLQYRWAAFKLRKLRRLPPEIVGHAIPSAQVLVWPCNEIVVAELPLGPGLYIFYDREQTLYVGEASGLRNRIEKHLDHSDNKGFARWLWEHGNDRVFLELHVLDGAVSKRVRRALEAELIQSRRPIFNVQCR